MKCITSFAFVWTISVLPSLVAESLATVKRCQDNPRFRFQGVDGYNCEWIASQDDAICDWEVVTESIENVEEDYVDLVPQTLGQLHCPLSCGHCIKEVSETMVYTDSVCYDPKRSHTRRGGIVVSFENVNPIAQDWIGVYPVSTTEESFEIGSILEEEPIAWSWTCDISTSGSPNMDDDDDISTDCKAEYNQAVFRQLPSGIYQVVLARFDDEVVARGPSFFEILGPSAAGSELCSQRLLEQQEEPCERLDVDSVVYPVGQDIQVHLEQCDESANADDFIAVYDADTELEDIKGDANYILWMWTCGSRFCHNESTFDDLIFGAVSNKHTWPLPPGEYQVHLVKHLLEQDRFASVAQSLIFTVVDEDQENLMEDCLDVIRSKDHCYQEGDDFSILLQNECDIIGEEDWIGFYAANSCSDEDQICQGEVVLWTMACHLGNCRTGHFEYRFHGYREDAVEEPINLPTGTYRVVLVAEEDDDDEEGPYYARLLSKPFHVLRQGDSCQLVEQQV